MHVFLILQIMSSTDIMRLGKIFEIQQVSLLNASAAFIRN